MKILYLTGFYPEIGGPFSASMNLIFRLVKSGFEVEVLSPLPRNYDEQGLDFAKKLPFKVHYEKENLSRSILPSFSFGLLKLIKKESKKNDLIHLNGVFDFYSIIVSLLDKPYILSPRGSFMENAYNSGKFKKKVFMSLFGNRIMRRARKIHLMTLEEKEHLLRYYPELEGKISLIPNGLDLAELEKPAEGNDLAEKVPVLKGKRVIFFLGRIHWIKGLDLLIPAFAKVIAESKDCHLLIAGEDGGDGYAGKIKALIKQLKIENDVTFCGLLLDKDKRQAFRLAEILVLPSYSENFGMAVVEAMASGLPAVVSDKVGIAGEIGQNNAGVVVETNAESVYRGIKSLLADENLRRRCSENGKGLVEKYYDINKVSERMMKMYEEVLKNA